MPTCRPLGFVPPLLVLLAGCPEEEDLLLEPTEEALFSCVLGALDADGEHDAFEDGGTAELTLGFQGFLFVLVHVLAEEEGPALADVVASLAPEGDDPFGTTQPEVPFRSTPEGRLSDEVLVFLPNANIAAWEGRAATLSARIRGEGQVCVATAEVVLVDEDPCIHTGDEPICPEEEP